MKPLNTLLAACKRIDTAIDAAAERLKDRTVVFYPSLAGPALFVIVSCAILVLMPKQIKVLADQTINARTFPTFLVAIMLGGSVMLLAREIIKLVRHQPIETIKIEILTEIKAAILFALLVLYALLLKPLTFIGSSIVYGVGMLYYFRIKKWQWYAIVTASAIIIGGVFRTLLHVRLP